MPVTLPETIVRRRCAALIPYARNARTHSDQQVAQIAASIREFGFTNPVLIDEEDGIIAGHGRVLAAHLLGLDEVPCIVLAHLTPAQRRAYVLADNKLALNAGWDIEMLSLEIGELGEAGFDLSLTGFDEFELGELFAERTQGRTDPDDAPEPPAHPVAEPGDLWALGGHRLLCGDSTVATDVERVLGGVAPHLMVTDPPYGVNYDPAWRNQAGRSINGTTRRIATGTVIKPIGARAVGKVVNDDRADWREAWALFPGSVAYIWHAGTKAGIVQDSLKRFIGYPCATVWSRTRQRNSFRLMAIVKSPGRPQSSTCATAATNRR